MPPLTTFRPHILSPPARPPSSPIVLEGTPRPGPHRRFNSDPRLELLLPAHRLAALLMRLERMGATQPTCSGERLTVRLDPEHPLLGGVSLRYFGIEIEDWSVQLLSAAGWIEQQGQPGLEVEFFLEADWRDQLGRDQLADIPSMPDRERRSAPERDRWLRSNPWARNDLIGALFRQDLTLRRGAAPFQLAHQPA